MSTATLEKMGPSMTGLSVTPVLGNLLAETNEATKTVLCRYCFNLDHWVPVSLVAIEVECRKCDVCPMYVPLTEWEEHQEHGGSVGSPIIKCTECPTCGGIIPPDEAVVPCKFCDLCKTYVPALLWGRHKDEGCYGQNDPFA